MTYQGWANHATWERALYLNNTYELYRQMTEYVKGSPRPNYDSLIGYLGLARLAEWADPSVDRNEINEMLAELKQEMEMYA